MTICMTTRPILKGLICIALTGLVLTNFAHAEFYTDGKALKQLLSGNSLVGTYNDLHFIQVLNTDGSLQVAVKGDKNILNATWFINEKTEYCEQWPDHTSCFQIGIDNSKPTQNGGQRLKVKGKDNANIVSYLHQGAMPLTFSTTDQPPTLKQSFD